MALLDQVLKALGSAEAQALYIGGALDLILRRFIKSQKPLGVLHAAAAFVKKLADVLAKLAAFSDKVLPQKLANPEQK
jgi:hypothetical protein